MKATASVRRCGRFLRVTGAALIFGVLAVHLGVSVWIGVSVRKAAAEARQRYAGDSVEALIQKAGDSGCALPGRNRAVWALGQLGDPRALERLNRRRTGEPCDHENRVCERELDKALRLLNGGVNLSAFVWR